MAVCLKIPRHASYIPCANMFLCFAIRYYTTLSGSFLDSSAEAGCNQLESCLRLILFLLHISLMMMMTMMICLFVGVSDSWKSEMFWTSMMKWSTETRKNRSSSVSAWLFCNFCCEYHLICVLNLLCAYLQQVPVIAECGLYVSFRYINSPALLLWSCVLK